MSEWISVKKRLPTIYTPVLIFLIPRWQYINDTKAPCSDPNINMGILKPGEIWFEYKSDNPIWIGEELTHWMPLPDHPKGDEVNQIEPLTNPSEKEKQKEYELREQAIYKRWGVDVEKS